MGAWPLPDRSRVNTAGTLFVTCTLTGTDRRPRYWTTTLVVLAVLTSYGTTAAISPRTAHSNGAGTPSNNTRVSPRTEGIRAPFPCCDPTRVAGPAFVGNRKTISPGATAPVAISAAFTMSRANSPGRPGRETNAQ